LSKYISFGKVVNEIVNREGNPSGFKHTKKVISIRLAFTLIDLLHTQNHNNFLPEMSYKGMSYVVHSGLNYYLTNGTIIGIIEAI
jgi:hypothetical protein